MSETAVAADVDVLVVGAGPTGLALAAVLDAHGAGVRVVDKLPHRVHESRALAVQPRTLEMLAGLGSSDALVARGNRAVRLQVHTPHRTTEVPLFDIGLDDTAYPYLLFVSQAETEAVLGDLLRRRAIAVERGVTLTALQPDDGGVTCRVEGPGGPEVIRARFVAGCDGAHSSVRDLVGIAFRGATYPQEFVLADLEADLLETGTVHAYLSADGPLLFFPLGRPATWRLIAMRAGTGGGVGVRGGTAADGTASDEAVGGGAAGDGSTTSGAAGGGAASDLRDELQRIADARTGGVVRLHDPVWATRFRLHLRSAERYRAGRVFLAGDAAHIHSPAGAQGMNTGIQDAVNLGWKLALVVRGRGTPALLDSYEVERLPVGRAVLRLTDRAFTVATSQRPVARRLRERVAPVAVGLATHAHGARALAFRTVAELRIGYRRSPLSAPATPDGLSSRGRHWRAPRAGDRLPDALVLVAGRTSTLHEALARPGFHLLLWDPHATCPPTTVEQRYADVVTTHRLGPRRSGAELEDLAGQLARRLGVTPDRPAHLLVRPDGHLALRGGGDLQPVRAYLERWLI